MIFFLGLIYFLFRVILSSFFHSFSIFFFFFSMSTLQSLLPILIALSVISTTYYFLSAKSESMMERN